VDPDIKRIVTPMHAPCRFMRACEGAWRQADGRVSGEVTLWNPAIGWVPRGFCGATAGTAAVELVLVAGEPSRPDADEMYDVEDSIEAASRRSKANMTTNRTITHRGMQYIPNFFFPCEALEKLFDRVFRMESVFCSIPKLEGEGQGRTCGTRPGGDPYAARWPALFGLLYQTFAQPQVGDRLG